MIDVFISQFSILLRGTPRLALISRAYFQTWDLLIYQLSASIAPYERGSKLYQSALASNEMDESDIFVRYFAGGDNFPVHFVKL